MGSKKIILFAVIAIVIVMMIGAGVYFFVFQGTGNLPVVSEEKKEEDNRNAKYEELRNNFNISFSNSVRKSITISSEPEKVDSSKEIVYSKYEIDLFSEDKYQMKVSIPYINLPGEEIDKINKEIDQIFGSKVNSVIQSKEMLSVYNVDYVAYLNDDMLSLAIRATLKENDMPQRVIIKTYNYNFARKEQVYLGTLLVRNGLDRQDVQNKINTTIEEIASINEGLEASGYTVYQRNVLSKIYKLENIDTYFVDQNDYLYIVFAYGNKNYTSELDLVIF